MQRFGACHTRLHPQSSSRCTVIVRGIHVGSHLISSRRMRSARSSLLSRSLPGGGGAAAPPPPPGLPPLPSSDPSQPAQTLTGDTHSKPCKQPGNGRARVAQLPCDGIA